MILRSSRSVDLGSCRVGSVNARVVERLKEIDAMGMDEEDKEKLAKEAAPAAAKAAKAPQVEKERARKKKDSD